MEASANTTTNAATTTNTLSEEAFNSAPAPMTQVLVSNISPTANEQSLASFFSFCGSITNLKLTTYAGTNKPSEAIVTFDSEAAAKTALLLTNAVIADRPIIVVPHGDVRAPGQASFTSPESGEVTELSGAQIPNKGYNVPDDQRSKISVVASLLAQGYTLGDDAIAKARSIDEQAHISERVSQAAAATRVKLAEIDQAYHISQTIGAIASGVAQKAQEVDQNWKISENVQHVMKNVSDTVEVIGAKAKESPVVQTTVNKLGELSSNVQTFVAPAVDTITTNASKIREQSNQMYQETKRERGELAGEPEDHGGIELVEGKHNVDKILVAEEKEHNLQNEQNEELEPPVGETKSEFVDLKQ